MYTRTHRTTPSPGEAAGEAESKGVVHVAAVTAAPSVLSSFEKGGGPTLSMSSRQGMDVCVCLCVAVSVSVCVCVCVQE